MKPSTISREKRSAIAKLEVYLMQYTFQCILLVESDNDSQSKKSIHINKLLTVCCNIQITIFTAFIRIQNGTSTKIINNGQTDFEGNFIDRQLM